MPITRLPVQHKFGIISQSQRLELQERLLKQTYIESIRTRKGITSTRNPLEVSEEFVQEFNSLTHATGLGKLEEVAYKMLERIKRRAGLKEFGVGSHVNLPLAWTEMAQLAHCKGKIQEDCLDVMINSLDVSPMEKYHIPVLFFLAENMLYWLRTDSVRQTFLRGIEVKLLAMGQLVFTRLFYHHMAGQLQGHAEFKNRLFAYLDGLQDFQQAYSPYPNALLSLRFIIEVGKIILADAFIEPGEVKEGDKVLPMHNLKDFSEATKELYDKRSRDDSHSNRSGAISSSVHDLSPTLWHSLDVWRCTNHLSGGFEDALKALSHCGLGLANESWVDGVIAIPILAEAAKFNLEAMKVLHRLAQGIKVTEDAPPLSGRTDSDEYSPTSNSDQRKKSDSRTPFSSKPSLSDICEHSEDSGSVRKRMIHSEGATDSSNDHSGPESPDKKKSSQKDSLQKDITRPQKPALKQSNEFQLHFPHEMSTEEEMANAGTREGQHTGKTSSGKESAIDSIRSKCSTANPLPGTGYKASAGTDLPLGRDSEASSVPTYTNMPMRETPGITGWHWEVAIAYCDILCDLCLHGANVNIQKMALIGTNKDLMDPVKNVFSSVPLVSAGLVDLVFFRPFREVKDGGNNDWSWRIRFGAIKSMVKICRYLKYNKDQDGLLNAAWQVLLKFNSTEKDSRVLEALKVGLVNTDIKGLIDMSVRSSPITVGTRIASGLAAIYLPPLPPAVEQVVPAKPRKRIFIRQHAVSQSRHPVRTSLKEEIMLATALYEPPLDYNKRTSFDLRRIVEDQWRKELQSQLLEEEEERREELTEQQEAEEAQQKKKTEVRKNKFKPGIKPQVDVSELKLPLLETAE